MPLTSANVPQVHASNVADINVGKFAEEDGGEEGGDEGDAGGDLVVFGILLSEAHDLRSTEALE